MGIVAAGVGALYAAHWIVPRPWWSKEAGSAPSRAVTMRSYGTGFFVTGDGWLLTDRHVTASCRRVTVGNGIQSGVAADRIVYPRDTGIDLAAIHVGRGAPSFLRLSDAAWPISPTDREVPVDEIRPALRAVTMASEPSVTVVGFPGNDHAGTPVSLRGKILGASTGDHRHWFLKLGAPVRPGASGSPVIDRTGDVEGIVFKASIDLPVGASAASRQRATALLPTDATQGLAIPAAFARALLSAIDATARGKAVPGAAIPNDAIVRVFCFR